MYQQGGIMQVAPRQGYFLGKLVKSVTKGVKKLVKSPIGKAAILGAVGFGIPGTGIGGLFGRASFGGPALGAFGKFGIGPTLFANPTIAAMKTQGLEKGFFPKLLGKMGTGTKLGLGGAFASYLASTGASEEEVEEIKRDKGKLSIYLKDYFTKLNPNASDEEVDEFVATNTSEYAVGGRVGFKEGKNMMMASAPDPADSLNDLSQMLFGKNLDELTDEEYDALQEKARDTLAVGGRVGFADGSYTFEQFMQDKGKVDSYMNQEQMRKLYEKMMREKKIREQRTLVAMGGMPTGIMRTNQAGTIERDYRDEGGFVPVGIKEKADDVPAMLSKNEFVMTADAVRGMGNGSIEKGAQRLYDQMKRLENKVA
jgi:hypothetical protein